MPFSAKEARQMILEGYAPDGMTINGSLDTKKLYTITRLPERMTVNGSLDLTACYGLTELPKNLTVTGRLIIDRLRLKTLPENLTAGGLIASECTTLESIPDSLSVKATMNLSGCTSLKYLPDFLFINGFLNLTGCTALTRVPADLRVNDLNLTGCTGLKELPKNLYILNALNLQGCTGLKTLPPRLKVGKWIDIGSTALTFAQYPRGLIGANIRWNGTRINDQTAFHPETLTAEDVLSEPNLETRRVMLERMGYERFFATAQAEEIDSDKDTGGTRRLLRVEVPEAENRSARRQREEPIVCLSVTDPSTGRKYILRVPPAMQTCHQAAAWIAGFNNPDEYKLTAES